MRSLRLLLALAISATFSIGCGGGDDTPDARPPADAGADAALPDAGPKAYCYDKLDHDDTEPIDECGYSPEPVLPSEISLADQLALAQRFNTAHVYTNLDIWAVSVDYVMAEGQPLMSAEHDGRIAFSYNVDVGTYTEVYPSGTDLSAVDFSALPTQTGGGRGLVYFLDTPGTATGIGYEDETWVLGPNGNDGWRAAQGYTDPATVDAAATNFPPTQYAHLFWLSKEDHLLAISYWYFHVFDKFQNNHEGDWEHTNVVLDYEDPAQPFIAFVHFSMHGFQMGRLASDLYRIGDRDSGDGDHVVVFSGGATCMHFDTDTWCGDASGASFPYPGVYDQGFVETVAGGTSRTGHPIHANDFNVVLLPRVEDVTSVGDPNITWYGMPVLFGEPITAVNDPVMQALHQDRSPVAPGDNHDEFEVGIEQWGFMVMRDGALEQFDAPDGWTFVHEPPASVFE